MAVWYARQSANINAANVWNSAADGSGSWLTWPPDPADVLVVNGFNPTLNVSTTVAEIRHDTTGGATAGGRILLTAVSVGLVLSANLYGDGAINYIAQATHTSGTVTIVGIIYGGAGTSHRAALNNSTGTLQITGDVYAGSGSNSYGIDTHASNLGTVNHTGNIYGGSGSATYGINNLAGTYNLTGNAIAGSVSPAVYVASTGPASVSGYAEAKTGQPAITNVAQAVVSVGETRSAANGRGAVLGAFRYASATAAKSLPIVAGSQKTLSVLNVAALVPAVEDVRQDVTYGDGAYTGTLPLNRKRTTMAGRF